MATAEISGVVALLLAKKAGLSADEAYRLLRDTSAHPGGGVLVDACAAMLSLVGHGYCNPTTDNGPRMAGELEQRFARH
jgi:hypothetical protein